MSAAIKILALCHGAFLLGISVVTLVHYAHNPRIRHIALVAASHLGLTVLICSAIWTGLYPAISLRTFAALACFALSDVAILVMLSKPH